ncbi:hypothetical protein [uncultured Hymenobacter sp.]|uniref:hypothetical protein n=1 Tax=uncultured Hymenobacter sp. TaxID=170016 RepID=UPI0035CC165A
MKSIPFAQYVALLKLLGLEYVRTIGSHQHWDFPKGSGKALLRTLTLRDKDKDIPVLHMLTNLAALEASGVTTKAEFEQLLAAQQNPKASKAQRRRRQDEGQ